MNNNTTNKAKILRAINLYYHKVGRMITKWGAIEESQYCYRNIVNIQQFYSAPQLFLILVHQ